MNSPDVDRLISSNQGWVVHLAKEHRRRVSKLCGARIGLADLIAAGKIGLAEAAKRFDPAKGKFSTYAAFWIKKYLFKARFKGPAVVYLSKPIGDGKITLLDAIADEKARSAPELLIAQETVAFVEACRSVMAGAGLDNREREIISHRYGMAGDEQKTQKQIAKNLGLTRARVSQLERIARGKIAAHARKLAE